MGIAESAAKMKDIGGKWAKSARIWPFLAELVAYLLRFLRVVLTSIDIQAPSPKGEAYAG